MELKHAVFFFLLFFGVPVAVSLIQSSRRLQFIGYFMLVFSVPFIYTTGINFYGDEFYKGTCRGYEVLATDLFSLTMFFVLRGKFGKKNFIWLPPGGVFYLLYIGISIVSMINTEVYLYSFWELWKMVKIYFFMVVIYNCIIGYKTFEPILLAFASIMIYTAFYMTIQKYLFAMYQPSGIFPHRNSAAMFGTLVGPIFFSAMLNAKLSKKEAVFYTLAFISSTYVIIVSLSRGAILIMPISYTIVALISIRQKITPRKIKVLLAISFFGLIGAAAMAPSVIKRFQTAPEESANTRIYLARAAFLMANDKFFGVGLNNWGVKINPPYTYWEDAGVPRVDDERKTGIVETAYMVVAAECGWIGLFIFFLLLGYYFTQNMFNIRRFKGSPGQYMTIGIFGGLIAQYGQSVLEWVLKQPANYYGICVAFAIIAAMYQSYLRFQNLSSR